MRPRVSGEIDRPRPHRIGASEAKPRQRARVDVVDDEDRMDGVGAGRRHILDNLLAVVVADTFPRARGREAPPFPAEDRFVDVDRRVVCLAFRGRGSLDEPFLG